MTTKPLSPHVLGVIKDTVDGLMADVRSVGRLVKPQCRYLDSTETRCTAEAVDALGEIMLCQRHLGLALELVSYHWKRRA